MKKFALLLAGMIVLASPAFADEGMWTFDNFQSAKVKAKYGVDITPAWLEHVRDNAVRLSTGCSASIVSANALVLTNNHCVAGCAQDLSSKAHDYYTHGYTAVTAAGERKCAGMQAESLTPLKDVAPQMTAAAKGLTGDAL